MLCVDDLGKRIEDRWIVRHISFALEPGQVLAILGRNGAGKSTVLRLVAGLWSPSEGRVTGISGDPRISVGYAGLDLSLYPNLSGREHLEFAGSLRQIPSRYQELLSRVSLDGAGEKPTLEYSSGMKTRLKLALAIQADPPLLLLDEPSASLDADGRALVASILAEQQLRGAALLATNDPAEARWATHEFTLLD